LLAAPTVTSFLVNSSLVASFPNLARLAAIAMVLPITTATVERSFSNMKLIKTRLRNRMGAATLDQTMRISIEGPEKISTNNLDNIIQHWKEQKKRKLLV
jgi:hypothetical protein